MFARLSPKMSHRQFEFESISAANGYDVTYEVVLHHLTRRYHPQLELPSKSEARAVAVWTAFWRAQRHSTKCHTVYVYHTPATKSVLSESTKFAS